MVRSEHVQTAEGILLHLRLGAEMKLVFGLKRV